MRSRKRIVAGGRAAEVAMTFVADEGEVVPSIEVAVCVRETARGAQLSGLCDVPVICSRRRAVGKVDGAMLEIEGGGALCAPRQASHQLHAPVNEIGAVEHT